MKQSCFSCDNHYAWYFAEYMVSVLKVGMRGGKMAQWAEALDSKPDNLRAVPVTDKPVNTNAFNSKLKSERSISEWSACDNVFLLSLVTVGLGKWPNSYKH